MFTVSVARAEPGSFLSDWMCSRKGNAMTFVTRRDWRHAEGLIEILEKSGQQVIPELRDMATRYKARVARDANFPRPRRESRFQK